MRKFKSLLSNHPVLKSNLKQLVGIRAVVLNLFHFATQFPTQGNLTTPFGEQNFKLKKKKVFTWDPSLILSLLSQNSGDLFKKNFTLNLPLISRIKILQKSLRFKTKFLFIKCSHDSQKMTKRPKVENHCSYWINIISAFRLFCSN